MAENYLIDTNVIIRFPSVFQHFKNLHVHLKTVEELDRLKESENGELAYRARKGAKLIAQNLDKIVIERGNYRQKTVDDILLQCAKKKKYTLITNDLTLELKCKFNKVKSESYTNGEKSIYSGTIITQIGAEENIEECLQLFDPNSFHQNQFLIFENINEVQIQTDGSERHPSITQFIKKEDEFVKVKDYIIRNAFYQKIESRNVEQKCLIHALYDDDIKIIVVAGGFGVGKSMLTVNFALQQLERGKINKIIYVPNNAQTANTREVAAIPGNLLEKESLFMGTLIDILEYGEIERRISDGTLNLMPISLARGRNIENSIILVNEAQNLTEEHIKLLIGRIGEGTKIIFDGDIHQTDRSVFKNSNGLKLLYKIKDSEYADLFCAIKLDTVERSRTAQIATYLDQID